MIIFRQRFTTVFGAAWITFVFGALPACNHYQAIPIVPEATGAALSARSLSDDGLRRYLAQNLGRELSPWPPAVWDFETLSWVAFYYQPSLAVARAQWDVARSAVKTASARPNPTLNLTPGYDTNSSGVSPWFPSVALDFLLETARKRTHRTEAAQFTAEAARLDVLVATWQVRSELRRALVEVAATDQRRNLLRDQVALEQQIVTLLERRRQAGAASAFEISAAKMALLKAEAAAAEAERLIPLMRNRLAQALGVSLAALDGIQISNLLSMPSPALSTDQLAAARHQSLQSRADVLGALARYAASEAALRVEVAKQYPDIQFGPGYQYDLGENKWSLAVSFELPLFNQNQGPIAEATAHRREAAAIFLATQARALAEIDGAAAAQSAVADQLVHLRRIQAELQKQAALVQARLTAGESDRLDGQNARIVLNAGELALLDAQVGAVTAAGQLEDTLQVPFQNMPALVTIERDVAAPPLP